MTQPQVACGQITTPLLRTTIHPSLAAADLQSAVGLPCAAHGNRTLEYLTEDSS